MLTNMQSDALRHSIANARLLANDNSKRKPHFS